MYTPNMSALYCRERACRRRPVMVVGWLLGGLVGQCVSILSLTYLSFPVWALDLTKPFYVLVVCCHMTYGLSEGLKG